MNRLKKAMATGAIGAALFASVAGPALAAAPGAAVKNPNANPNACWGMDRAYYASMNFFPKNQNLNQSFPGDLNEELHAWIETYCEPHGNQEVE